MSHDVTKSVTFFTFSTHRERKYEHDLPYENLGLNVCFCPLLFVCILGLNVCFCTFLSVCIFKPNVPDLGPRMSLLYYDNYIHHTTKKLASFNIFAIIK